ncbi:helix-turn-helix domain-containing protein [Streptomyces sporangiiformans]|uniref:Helix-turn-helix domain-containing protein n=1 Tax=Streptomyces sporangiiformans TaxID=2315329 RepID=A0A505DRA8_9ACTN|nr:helix-turn-helix domain-containing protein [Streptomyces sporangiiformans]TPQ23834.1 helix-turn-helix domain-containing protein [Streptomyces sporangiiformans]
MHTGALHVHHATVGQLQRAASSVLAPLAVTAPDAGAFRADIDAAALGCGAVARIRGSGHVVSRLPRAITSTDPELLKVTLHGSGNAIASQGRSQSPAGSGDLVVLDMTRPYRLAVSEGCDVIAVGVPRAALGRHCDAVARLSAQRLPTDSGAQAVLAAFLSGLGRHLDELAAPADSHVADALVSLLVAAFTERVPEQVDTATDLVDRIRVYALANIADPSLCVESVAAAHGISARHLHRLFRHTGTTFAAWLRSERLDRIRRDLLDPAHAGRTAAAVAARWGLHDPGHIGRALKARYGQTARDLREAAATGPAS